MHTLQDALTQLRARVDALAARLQAHATLSTKRPPPSDAPDKKPRHRPTAPTPRKAGGQPGHPGPGQVRWPPTTVQERRPERWAGGPPTCALPTPYHTPQGIALPPSALEVTHWLLPPGWGGDCGGWTQAQVPAAQSMGYGPRFSARMGAWAGPDGHGRRRGQTLCAAGLQVPL
ncbi:MAG TPA: hypothetical protein VLQ80_03570, partial [Candidatus Saccharimonadia bacterium]|nr:hypothetical protein [Candidatus Saccharimonadia bacterium]